MASAINSDTFSADHQGSNSSGGAYSNLKLGPSHRAKKKCHYWAFQPHGLPSSPICLRPFKDKAGMLQRAASSLNDPAPQKSQCLPYLRDTRAVANAKHRPQKKWLGPRTNIFPRWERSCRCQYKIKCNDDKLLSLSRPASALTVLDTSRIGQK